MTLEIDIHTQLRGPLAERLIKRAAALKKPPVETLADLVEQALSNERTPLEQKYEAQIADLKERHYAVIADFKTRIAELQSTPLPQIPPNALVIELPPTIQKSLSAEAARLNTSPIELATRLLTVILQDGMINAVLDEQ